MRRMFGWCVLVVLLLGVMPAQGQGEALLTLSHEDAVLGAAWNADGSRILTYSAGGVWVWDVLTGEVLLILDHEQELWGPQYSPDESRILTFSFDGARAWDAATGDLLFEMPHDDRLTTARWSRDGSRILTVSMDEAACLWDGETGEQLFLLDHGSPVFGATWNVDNTRLITWTWGGLVTTWDGETGINLAEFRPADDIKTVAFSPDQTRFLAASHFIWGDDPPDDHVLVYTVEDEEFVIGFGHELQVQGAAWNADGTRILSWSDTRPLAADVPRQGLAQVWDVATGDEIARMEHPDEVRRAAWSPDETRIFTLSLNTIRVWETASGKLLFTFDHEDTATGAAWSADGTRLLSWSEDGTARVWVVGHE